MGAFHLEVFLKKRPHFPAHTFIEFRVILSILNICLCSVFFFDIILVFEKGL